MELLNQIYKDFKQLLSSRTVIVLLLIFLFNITEAFTDVLRPEVVIVVNIALTTLATYFRVNLRAKF